MEPIKGSRYAITLIELLVVIAVLAILAGVAGPNLNGWACRQDIKNDFAELNGFLSTLRSEAVNRNSSILAYSERTGDNALISTRVGSQGVKSNCNIDSITETNIVDKFTTDINKSSLNDACFHADGSATTASYTLARQCGGSFDNGGKKYEYKNQIFSATGFIQKFKRVLNSDGDSQPWQEM